MIGPSLRIEWLVVSLVALAAILLTGCGDQQRPNILLVSIDSLRADHLHSYGYERETSPAMDRLAAEGVRFRTAIAPSSWTLPSHVTMLTGIPPHHHNVNLDGRKIGPKVRTLAEIPQPWEYELPAEYKHLLPEDLTAAIRGESGLSPNLAFGDFEDYLLTVRRRDAKLYMSPKDFFSPRLFDLTADPGEQQNVAAERPGVTTTLLEASEAFRAGDVERRDEPAKIDQEQLERLKSLGYVR